MQFLTNLFYKPQHITLKVTSSNGFHLRPIAQFVSLSKTLASSVRITIREKSVDAKNMSSILALSMEKGDSFTLTTQGKNALSNLTQLQTLF